MDCFSKWAHFSNGTCSVCEMRHISLPLALFGSRHRYMVFSSRFYSQFWTLFIFPFLSLCSIYANAPQNVNELKKATSKQQKSISKTIKTQFQNIKSTILLVPDFQLKTKSKKIILFLLLLCFFCLYFVSSRLLLRLV